MPWRLLVRLLGGAPSLARPWAPMRRAAVTDEEASDVPQAARAEEDDQLVGGDERRKRFRRWARRRRSGAWPRRPARSAGRAAWSCPAAARLARTSRVGGGR